MNKSRTYFEAVYINDEIYVFGGIDDKKKAIKSVEKYSPVINT